MNIKALQHIASWLLLCIAVLPIFHPSITILIIAFITGTLLALAVFCPKTSSLPWLLCGAGLLVLSFANIPDQWSDKARLMTLISICVAGLMVANLSFFYFSKEHIQKHRD